MQPYNERYERLFLAILSLIAVAISWKSCSNSEKAITLSESHFAQEIRPYLQMKPIRIKDSDEFLSIQQSNNQAKIILHYELKNTGRSAATNIIFAVQENELNIGNRGTTTTGGIPEGFTLGPSESIKLAFPYILPKDLIGMEKTIDNPLWKGILLVFKFSYTGIHDNNVIYTARTSDRIWKNRAIPVDSK